MAQRQTTRKKKRQPPAKPPAKKKTTPSAAASPPATSSPPTTPPTAAEAPAQAQALKDQKTSRQKQEAGRQSGASRRRQAADRKMAGAASPPSMAESPTGSSGDEINLLVPLESAIIIAMMSDALAHLAGPQWGLDAEEQSGAKTVLDALIEKYAPSLAGYGVEVAAAIFVGGYILRRMKVPEHGEADVTDGPQGNGKDVPAERAA